MRTTKVAVTIDSEVLDQARELAGGNLSAYVNGALLQRVKNDLLGRYLDDYQVEHGAFTEEELEETRRLLAG